MTSRLICAGLPYQLQQPGGRARTTTKTSMNAYAGYLFMHLGQPPNTELRH